MFKRSEDARLWGVTAVENAFILDYLPGARGDYVKVYLWGLYHSQRDDENMTVQDMAAALEMTVPDVEKAFRFWERRALVTIESDNPFTVIYKSVFSQVLSGNPVQAESDYVDFAESVYAAFGSRRKVKPDEVARAWEWVQDIGLTPEAVLMLLNHCIASWRPQFSFKKAEALAVAMKESGAVTAEDAESFLRNDLNIHAETRQVLRALGKRGRLESDAEIALYRKWRDEWGFTLEAILAACDETPSGEPNFAYLDGILREFHDRNKDARTGKAVRDALDRENDEAALAREIVKGFRPAVSREFAVNLYRQWRKTFPHAVLKMAADECRATGKGAEAMTLLLSSWEEKGLTNEKKAADYLAAYREETAFLQAVFAACDLAARPTAADHEWLRERLKEGRTHDQIREAAQKARLIKGNKLAYIEKVLSGGSAPAFARGPRPVTAQQYEQRQYTEEELAALTNNPILKILEEEEAEGK